MGSYYKQQCLSTAFEYHQAVASNCPHITDDGHTTIQCVPDASKVQIQKTTAGPLGPVTTSIDYVPVQIDCDPDLALSDAIDLAWMVVSVWVAAWVVRQVVLMLRS